MSRNQLISHTNQLIPPRRQDQVLINKLIINKKRELIIHGFSYYEGSQRKNKRKHKDRQFMSRTRKAMEHVDDGYSICNYDTLKGPKSPERKAGEKKNNLDHTDYIIIKIGEYTGKSPRDLRKLAVTQTLVKYHQLTQERKIHGE